ncbi:hypothetical protein HZB90_03035 [archaeon]|nr:hypothetical protein [archaeon]
MSLERLLRFAKSIMAPLGIASSVACSAGQSSGTYSPVVSDWRSLFSSSEIVACIRQDSLLHCAVMLDWDERMISDHCGGSMPYCTDFHDGEFVDDARARDLISQGVHLIKVLDDAGRSVYSTPPIVRVYCTEKQYEQALADGVLEENPILEMMRHGQFPY